MTLDLMQLAIEAAHAEHATVSAGPGGSGIHANKGCHACTLYHRLMGAVREAETQWPPLESGSLWSLGGGNKAALFIRRPMSHREWEMLVRLVHIMEPAPEVAAEVVKPSDQPAAAEATK